MLKYMLSCTTLPKSVICMLKFYMLKAIIEPCEIPEDGCTEVTMSHAHHFQPGMNARSMVKLMLNTDWTEVMLVRKADVWEVLDPLMVDGVDFAKHINRILLD